MKRAIKTCVQKKNLQRVLWKIKVEQGESPWITHCFIRQVFILLVYLCHLNIHNDKLCNLHTLRSYIFFSSHARNNLLFIYYTWNVHLLKSTKATWHNYATYSSHVSCEYAETRSGYTMTSTDKTSRISNAFFIDIIKIIYSCNFPRDKRKTFLPLSSESVALGYIVRLFDKFIYSVLFLLYIYLYIIIYLYYYNSLLLRQNTYQEIYFN